MVMQRNEIVTQVNDIFIAILDNDKVALTETTTALEVEEWDSLTHIQLVLAIEKHFKIRFTSKEIQSWNNVGGMVDSISKKIALKAT